MNAARLSLLVGLAMMARGAAADDTITPRGHQLQAIFLYNVTKFVQWPATTFPSGTDPIIIGVLGEHPSASELELSVRDRKVNGRGFVVRHVLTADEARHVHVLFVEADQQGRVPTLRTAIQDQPVLTVGEDADFSRSGGAITIVRAGNRLRFEINMTAAERAHLRVSSQLQKLATSVTRILP